MFWARRSNTLFTRIALALLVAVALVPTLSRMLSIGQGLDSPWMIGCTVPAADGSDPAGEPATGVTDHCPMCSVQVQGWHGTTQWSLWDQLPAPRDLLPLLFLWVAIPLFAWAAKQPRGPPLRA